MNRLAAVLLVVGLATGRCAGKQITNRQVVIGAAIVVGIAALIVLAISQCNKGANYCDNEDSP